MEKLIDEVKFSEKKCKISDISEEKKLTGKIKDGYYLSQTYLKNRYLKKFEDFPLEHTNILEEKLNRQDFYSKLEKKNKKKRTN